MTQSQFASSSDNVHIPSTQRPVRAMVKAPSLVIVNTGDGKGKTTAALGTHSAPSRRDGPSASCSSSSPGAGKCSSTSPTP
jgi:hypothetical protein